MLIKMKEMKPSGYWQDINNVVAEAKEVMNKYNMGELPSFKRLHSLRYSSLAGAIQYHGGFHKFRRLLGHKQKRVENGLWKNQEYILSYIKKLKEENGWKELPGEDKLEKIGHTNLAIAINRYHGGFRKFRKLLGEKSIHGIWKTLEHTLNKAMEIMKENDWSELPNGQKLIKVGQSGLTYAIIKYHGGFHKFRELLFQRQLIEKAGTWENLEFTLERAKQVIEEQGWSRLPGSNKIAKIGENGLVYAITRYHGGFPTFRSKLNQYLGRKTEKEQLEGLLQKYTT